MSHLAYIPTGIWSDPDFQNTTWEARLVFIYLLSCPYRESHGVFSISINRISCETGLDNEAVKQGIAQLYPLGVFYDYENSVVTTPHISMHGKYHPFGMPLSAWKAIRLKVFKRDDFTCQYCGVRGAQLECDHRIPYSCGGSNDLPNLATACVACNRSKGALTDTEFIAKRGL